MSPREVDSAQLSARMSIGVWAVAVGSILGGAAGFKAGGAVGALIGIPIAIVMIYSVAMMIVIVAGRTASSVVNPSGKSTPPKRDYSLAQSFVARARFEDAISAYEVACAEHPEDPEPYMRLARLYRDNLGELEEAIQWFKRARGEAKLTGRQEQLITLEIVEIYRDKLSVPKKAIPELARLAERFANTPVGESAKRELEQLRARALKEEAKQQLPLSRQKKNDDDGDAEQGYVSLQPD